MNRENDLPGRRRLAWEPSGLYRGKMEWQEGSAPEGGPAEGGAPAAGLSDGCVLFTCPQEGLDYLLYAADRDGDVCLSDYSWLCLEPEVLEEHSMCFQLSFYESRQERPEEGGGYAHHLRASSGDPDHGAL